MNAFLFTSDFESLRDTDTVADATRCMLQRGVSDLPVVDAAGKLVGIFKLDRLLAGLLPAGALIGWGMSDLSFVSDSLAQLRSKMREVDARPVRDFVIKPDHVAHPDTGPLEIVLLLYRGANNVPVVEPGTGKLVGMVSAREVLSVLHQDRDK